METSIHIWKIVVATLASYALMFLIMWLFRDRKNKKE